MILEKVTELVLSHAGQLKKTPKCYNFNCPMCLYMGEPRNDTKQRGGFFIMNDHIGYHCYNCQYKFKQYEHQQINYRVKLLLENLGVMKSEVNKLTLSSLKNKPTKFKTVEKIVTADFNFKDITLNSSFHFIHQIIKDDNNFDSDLWKAYNYAEDRGIDHWLYLMWSSDTKHSLNKRLTIPYIFNKKIIGYTARRFDNGKDRYISYNPNGGNYIFNIESVLENKKFLLITESAIDSIPFNAVGTLSATPTDKQIAAINRFRGTKILVPDFGNSGAKLVDIAKKNKWSVYFPFWDSSEDLGKAYMKYGKIFVLQDILSNYENNPVKIEVQKNIKIKNS